MPLICIKDIAITPGSKVLVRCDLDVPVADGRVVDTFRLKSCLDTLKFIIAAGAVPVILGSLGRPDGFDESLSTKHLKPFFDNELGGTYELLENCRFDPREKLGDMEYAKELVEKSGATLFVNESFGMSHRAYTSIVTLPKLLPSYAGFTLHSEVLNLSKVVKSPARPLVAIIGGAKLESKKPLVTKFVEIADYVLVGGKIGLEWDTYIPQNLFLPLDYSDETKKDIGIKTAEAYTKLIKRSATVVWAGPLGFFEHDNYCLGTNSIAQAVTSSNAFSVAGGGDTIHALTKAGLLDKFSFVSTGGGAMLEFLVRGNLPGLLALGYNQ